MAKCSAKLSYGGCELRQTPANQTRLPPTEAGGGKSYTPTLPLDRAIEQSQARKYFLETQFFFSNQKLFFIFSLKIMCWYLVGSVGRTQSICWPGRVTSGGWWLIGL